MDTSYQRDTYVDVATGTYDMDCSGYVGYVLQRIAPRHYPTIPSDSAAGRPLAFDFYDRFSELPPEGADGWRPVKPLPDARSGDIVAWRSELIEPGELGSGRIHFRFGDSGWEFQFGPGDSYHECPIAVGRIQPLSG